MADEPTSVVVRRRLIGVAGLAAIVLVLAVLVGMYRQAFTPVTTVTVLADRSGLLLAVGASVRVSGVPVGEVRKIAQAEGGKVALTVALDKDTDEIVTVGSTASIRATTVFGNKFVELSVPARSAQPVAEGAVIQANGLTVEANDVFQHGIRLLEAVDASKLNTTLGQIASALEGRGDDLGEYIEKVDTYLKAINPSLPQLKADLRLADDVFRTYDAAAPELIETAQQAGVTSVTLDENSASLHALLIDIVGATQDAGILVTSLEQPFLRFIDQATPVTNLLRVFSPGVGCLLDNTAEFGKVVGLAVGNARPGLAAGTLLLPPHRSYEPGRDKPKIVTGIGPICYPNPATSGPALPPHIRFPDGSEDIYDGYGPVVNPGTMGDPYGNVYDPPGSDGPVRSGEEIIDLLLGSARSAGGSR